MRNILSKFNAMILLWFDQYGRKTLPWQHNKTAYRVWVSEIMLQQTQVATVIEYFQRFMTRFPTLQSLAIADENEVLHYWAGLGYYSRARNLHKTAKIVWEAFSGQFPADVAALQALPGIGRSTAGAIAAIAFGKKATILDGNVKRVLIRFHGLMDPPDKITDTLWQLAEAYTPTKRVADYTQAIMDIGATLCIRGKPHCTLCPLKKHCMAHQQGIEKIIPTVKKRALPPIRQTTFLILIRRHQEVLLEKRPANGIWGNLWSLPEISDISLKHIEKTYRSRFPWDIQAIQLGASFRHTFTHFHLDILPAFIHLKKSSRKMLASENQIWYNLKQPEKIGLPAPVKKLLGKIPHVAHDSLCQTE